MMDVTARGKLVEFLIHAVGARDVLPPDGATGPRPLAIVRPRNVDQVQAVMRLCANSGVAVVARGGGTGLVRGHIPVAEDREVVMDLSGLNRILDFDETDGVVTVEAGCILEAVNIHLSQKGYFLPIRLASQGSCQIGGNLATNAGGTNVVRFGMARNSVLGLEVVLADGSLWSDLRPLAKKNAGCDLKQLFIGSEGTLGIITKAVLQCQPVPVSTATALVSLDSLASLPMVVARFRRHSGLRLNALELLPASAAALVCRHRHDLSAAMIRGQWQLLVEICSDEEHSYTISRLEEMLAGLMEEELLDDAVLAQSNAQAARIWELREAISETQNRFHVFRHDVSVPPKSIPQLIAEGTRRGQSVHAGLEAMPFGHAADGNIHFNFLLDRDHPIRDTDAIRQQLEEAIYDVVTSLGGSISAEHGIGRTKLDAARRWQDPILLNIQGRLKAALDPSGILNPGKVTMSAPLSA